MQTPRHRDEREPRQHGFDSPTGSAHGTSYSLRGFSPCRLEAIKGSPGDVTEAESGLLVAQWHGPLLPSCSTIPTIGIVRPYTGRYTGYPERYPRYLRIWKQIDARARNHLQADRSLTLRFEVTA